MRKTKKSFCWILLMGMTISVLSSCENTTENENGNTIQTESLTLNMLENGIESGISDIEESNNKEEGADISDMLNEESSLALAKDIFSVITGISQEWEDGLFVVNGINVYGEKICGIMNKKGEVDLFDEYSVLYPLESGYMIASTDEEMSGDILTEWKGITGKIIDENRNIIYECSEGEPFQRMYIINSKHVFIMSASPGFEGIDVKWGEIDYNGKWSHALDNFENQDIEDAIKQAIKMEKDGREWNFDFGMWMYRSRQNNVLIIEVIGEFEPSSNLRKWHHLMYWTDDEMMMEYDLEDRISEGISEFGEEKLLVSDILGHYFIGKDGSVEQIDNLNSNSYITGCIGIIDDKAYFGSVTDEIYDISGTKLIFPDNFMNRVRRQEIYNETFFFVLEGDDGMEYMAIADAEGNLVIEPFLLQGSVKYWDIQGDNFVYAETYSPEQGTPRRDSDIHIVNYDTKVSVTITKKFVSLDGVIFLDEDLFAIYWEENDIKRYEVYDILGNKIN